MLDFDFYFNLKILFHVLLINTIQIYDLFINSLVRIIIKILIFITMIFTIISLFYIIKIFE